MRSRRSSSLWGSGNGDMVAQFNVGDLVRPVIVKDSAFHGVIRDVCPKTNKLMVAWGGGDISQHDPEEVQLVLNATASSRRTASMRVAEEDVLPEVDVQDDASEDAQEPGSGDDTEQVDEEDGIDSPEESEEQTDFVADPMEDMLNQQVAFELYSAYIYWAASAWVSAKGLDGFAGWLNSQGNDEVLHAKKIMDFLMETGSQSAFPEIPAPTTTWESMAEVTRDVLDHEMQVTARWKTIDAEAQKGENAAVKTLSAWFLAEQVEEESGAASLHQKVLMAGEDGSGILVIDNGLAKTASRKVAGQQKSIIVDWNDSGSIRRAEKMKATLENAGWSLVRTRAGLTTSTLVYEKDSKTASEEQAIGQTEQSVGEPEARGVEQPIGGGFDVMQQLVQTQRDTFKPEMIKPTVASRRGRKAMYWCAPDRTYRMTKCEQEGSPIQCPQCKAEMALESFTRTEKMYVCPECRFKVPTSKVVKQSIQIDVDSQGDISMEFSGSRRAAVDADPQLAADLKLMKISDIAELIQKDHRANGKQVNFGAKPYLSAMYGMDHIDDSYGMDSGYSIVAYLLSNLSSWKGPVAVAVKKELKRRMK